MAASGVSSYVLLTRLPLPALSKIAQRKGGAFDLHALSTPPAFILGQDQTLIIENDPRKHRTAFVNQLLILYHWTTKKCLDVYMCTNIFGNNIDVIRLTSFWHFSQTVLAII